MPKSHPYGKAVVGEDEVEEIRSRKKTGSNIYGPAVVGSRDAASAKGKRVVKRVAKEEVQETDKALSVKDLGELLKDHPEILDRQIDAEFAREEPRKTAFRLFLQVEANRDGGPRADVLALLENALTDA